MTIVQRPNLVWLLVDGVRRYATDQDLRGKLPMMERFGEHSVEFLNVVTSAPSTIMSISAMMTGMPAYFLARNYDDFRFDNQYFVCLNDILKQNGYSSYAFLRGQETREKFLNLLDPVPRKHWAPHLRHGFKWTNQDLNLVLERTLEHGIPQPAFLFFHYNPHTPRIDPETSNTVDAALHLLLESGFSYGNTIYVICSDHGFPDPSTGITTEWEIEHNLTHDLLLTDDNIMIPLYIRYPGCEPKKIEATVSSLDIMPTLLDLTGIGLPQSVAADVTGKSLHPLLAGGEPDPGERRYFRCDARLIYQSGRVTAIRDAKHKYIRFHDSFAIPQQKRQLNRSEAFYDLSAEPLEERNLIASNEATVHQRLDEFRAAFERTEHEAFTQQVDYLLALFRQRVDPSQQRSDATGRTPRLLLMLEPLTGSFGEIALDVVARRHHDAQIDLLLPQECATEKDFVHHRGIFLYECDAGKDACRLADDGLPFYDLAFLVVMNPSDPSKQGPIHLFRQVKAQRALVLDCNMRVYRRRRYWYFRLRALLNRVRYFKDEPSLLWRELRADVRFVHRLVVRRLGLHERWSA